MINEIDEDNNGEIDFDGAPGAIAGTRHAQRVAPLAEFVAVMSRKVHASYTPEQVKNAFKVCHAGAARGARVCRPLLRVVSVRA